MSRIKRISYERRTSQRLAEGRGQGMGADYLPWLRVQDVTPSGTCWRIRGWATGRRHEIPDMLHASYFYMLDWPGRRDITDIREQYPLLPVTQTMQIAHDLGVRHPRHQPYNKPTILITSFLITSTKGLHARQVMYSQHAEKPHIQGYLSIERNYWESQGVDWRLVTEQNMPTAVADNARLLHKYVDLSERVDIEQTEVTDLAETLANKIRDEQLPLRWATQQCDKEFKRKPGDSLAIAYHLIATGAWVVDMTVPINSSEPLAFTKERIDSVLAWSA